MSNLYKTWFVNADTSNARVINSDAIMAECLEKNAVRIPEPLPEMQTEGGFTEGLFIGEASSVIKAEPEVDYVALAKEEAERVLQEAREQAEQMVEQAQAEVDEICEAARAKGYEDGKEALAREVEEQRAQLEESYQKRHQSLEAEYVEKRAGMEKDLVDVILNVFNKVFHIQFDNKKHILMHLIDDAIMNIEGEKRFRVKVAMSNVLFLENPPYMNDQHGLKNPDLPKAIARHEVLCTLEDVVREAAKVLKVNGRFYMVHRPFRLVEIINTLSKYKLEAKRMRFVHPYIDKEPNMVLIEAVKGGKSMIKIENPLIVYKEPNVYEDEIYKIYGY